MPRDRDKLSSLLEASSNGQAEGHRRQMAREAEERLVKAYAPHDLGAVAVEAFRRRVREATRALLARCNRMRIAEKDLCGLEDEVRELASQLRTESLDAERRGVMGKRGVESGKSAGGRVKPSFSSASAASSPSMSSSGLRKDDFQVLMEADRAQFLRESEAARAQELVKKSEVKQALDRQVASERARRAEAQRAAEEAARAAEQAAREHEAREREEKAKRDEKLRADKELRDGELARHKALLARREARQRREEDAQLKRIQEELRQDRVAKQERAREQLAYINKVREENAAQRAARQEMRLAEWEEDKKRDAEYLHRLEMEDRKRKAMLERMHARAQNNQTEFKKVADAVEAQAREDEARARRVQAEHEQRAKEAEARKEAKRREDVRAMHESLRAQLDLRAKNEADEREALAQAGREAVQEAEAHRESERQRAARRRMEADQLREALDAQVAAKRASREFPTQMSRREQALNAPLMRRIEGDSQLCEIVKRNVRPRPDELRERRARAHSQAGKVIVKANYF